MTLFKHFTPSGIVDPFEWCEPRNYGAPSGTRKFTQYRPCVRDELEWQRSVYEHALSIYEANEGFARILDLGCGAGTRSLSGFGGTGKLIQVDRNDFRDDAVKASDVPFEQISLEQYDDLEALLAMLNADERTLIVCADVIEHLIDPRPLLSFIRRVLMRHPDNVAVLSTPNHDSVEGVRSGGQPSSREHYRQWSVFGMGRQLRSAGFEVTRFGKAEMHAYDETGHTIIAELRCSPEHYAAFLAQAGIPKPAQRLLITGEHKLCNRGGGIGAYALESDIVLGDESIVLFHGQYGYHGRGDPNTRRQWLHVEDMVTEPNAPVDLADDADTAMHLLEAVKTLVFLYPEIEWIECPDYLGQAHAVFQAKMAAVLPSRIRTVCYCHGNHVYLEVNNSQFFFDPAIHQREKACIETADLTLIPSDFLEGLYRRAGIHPRKTVRLPSPYTFTRGVPDVGDYGRIRNIVFFGKRTRGKGYFLFAEALNQLAGTQIMDGIEKIYIAGVGDAIVEFDERLKSKIENVIYPNARIVDLMAEARHDTLAVVPYLGDNFPYSVHELIDAGVPTIFARAGGVPEVYDGCDPHGVFTFEPKPAALADKILGLLKTSAVQRGAETVNLGKAFRSLHEGRNYAFKSFFSFADAPLPPARPRAMPPYDVVITYHNEEARYVKDALDGIALQQHRPDKVIFVDDFSQPEAIAKARKVINAETRLTVHVVRPERNLGLSGARCFGMSHVTNDFFLVHDVDNILRADATDQHLRLLMADDRVVAATSHNCMFEDHTDWIDDLRVLGVYRPIYPDLGEIEDNTFGDALAMYRKSAVEAVGAWRSTGREPLEDFELFYRLVSSGYKVGVIPDPLFFYRVRPHSMLRTYDRFGGFLRVADAITEKLGTDGLSIVRHVQYGVKLRDVIKPFQSSYLGGEDGYSMLHESQKSHHLGAVIQKARGRLNHSAKLEGLIDASRGFSGNFFFQPDDNSALCLLVKTWSNLLEINRADIVYPIVTQLIFQNFNNISVLEIFSMADVAENSGLNALLLADTIPNLPLASEALAITSFDALILNSRHHEAFIHAFNVSKVKNYSFAFTYISDTLDLLLGIDKLLYDALQDLDVDDQSLSPIERILHAFS